MATAREIQEEIDIIAEYARVYADFEVNDEDGKGPCIVKVIVGGRVDEYRVSPSWVMGNLKRLPDRTTLGQIRLALEVSHPEVLGVGPKNPPPRD
jgi:hypothetical protein